MTREGYGKTIAALKVALNACHNGKTNRIIYIAPYLSILSQATEEIEKLTSMEVLQQHHLSIAESEEIDERKLFILDTWQAAIVTSTLNQLFKTVFPKRAQHTMRLESLKNSFIIIDEPQIITPAVWNAFLLMMDILTQKLESKVLFITATMPPTKYGLITKPVKLEPDKISWLSRYEVLLIKEPWDENVLTDQVSNELRKVDNIAVVVNTIKDSINIYRKLKEKLEGQKVKIINLHGNMLPGHKSRIIEYIKHVTKNSCDKLILVSTQIIEAGIDLSFDTIFRALPITPSVGQTAGRVNRHNEREKGKVIVFKFLRNGEEDTRKYIYKDKDIRKITDEWFSNTGTQTEKELYDNIKDYYEQTFARNEQMKSLNYLVEAANGKWSSIAKLSLPFDEQYKKHEVFVPTELYINEKTRKLMEEFGIDTPKNVYKHYQNREWLSKLDFLSIKRFMGLMGNFVVNINEKTFNFLKCNGKIQEKETTISLLKDIDYYSKETGFGEITF